MVKEIKRIRPVWCWNSYRANNRPLSEHWTFELVSLLGCWHNLWLSEESCSEISQSLGQTVEPGSRFFRWLSLRCWKWLWVSGIEAEMQALSTLHALSAHHQSWQAGDLQEKYQLTICSHQQVIIWSWPSLRVRGYRAFILINFPFI